MTLFSYFKYLFYCRPVSESSSIGKVVNKEKIVTDSGYVVPRFDFEQPEFYDGPPDINEVC